MRKIKFWNISGRGWITEDQKYCHNCHVPLGNPVERPATEAEYYGIILPLVQKNADAHPTVVEFEVPTGLR